jgi:hypothetical protein
VLHRYKSILHTTLKHHSIMQSIMERHEQKATSPLKGTMPFKNIHGHSNQKYTRDTKSFGTQKYKESTDQTREILRLVLPINKSGTKQLVLSADPDTGFQVSLTIRSTGSPGIKINGTALEKFLASFDEINNYFEHGAMENMELMLSKTRSINFGHHFQKRAVFLKMNDPENEKVYSIVLNHFTWPFLVSMRSLLTYTIQNLKSYTPELQKMFETLKKHLSTKFNMKEALDPYAIENFLTALDRDEIQIIPDPNNSMDYVRSFYEMKRYCQYSLMSAAFSD